MNNNHTALDFEAKTLLQHAAHPILHAANDYKDLIADIGDCKLVLIGEASHGTHEFYRERARITQQLIIEKGFTAVAVEADWPDSYKINQYVKGNLSQSISAVSALDGFKRFPTWMWRNLDVLDFISWLKGYNDELLPTEKIGFYGLDLYSLYTSIGVVIGYLEKVDPEAVEKAKQRYACFDRFEQDLQEYSLMSAYGLSKDCEEEVIAQLQELRHHAWEYAHHGQTAEEAFFNAEMNAWLAKDAEHYYRTMFTGRVKSWNLRDTHMFNTLKLLLDHLSHSKEAKVIVWAHNSHVGDARATELGRTGELNIGQLVRQEFKDLAYLIGFSTDTGTVTAASNWDSPAERKHVREALPGSYEALFSQTGIPNFFVLLQKDPQLKNALIKPRLERAIGVIYAPQTERQSHYFHAVLPDQFDAIIYFNNTQAVEPLEKTVIWEKGEIAETFPSSY